jgi:Na+/melibiose symporter-like transporter
LRNCWKACEYSENRVAFLSVAVAFGAVYAFSMFFLAAIVRERDIKDYTTANFPASVNTMSFNFAFRKFLIPTMLDTAIIYIIFPFLPYFVQYILNPVSFCAQDSEYYGLIRCRSSYWIGFIVLSYVAGTLIALPGWMMSIKILQKKVSWGFSSLCQLVIIPALAACGDKYMITAMVLFFFLGLAQGGSFINRSILGDVIDYDEFLQNRRSEGMYTG